MTIPEATPPGAQQARPGEIFSLPHLAEHAARLAADHADARPTGPLRPLLEEFRRTRDDLLRAYASIQAVARERRDLVPAEEWLLDNFHVIKEQLREIVEDLPDVRVARPDIELTRPQRLAEVETIEASRGAVDGVGQ